MLGRWKTAQKSRLNIPDNENGFQHGYLLIIQAGSYIIKVSIKFEADISGTKRCRILNLCANLCYNIIEKDSLLFKRKSIRYTYIYGITWYCDFVHVSIEMSFKTATQAENDDIALKLDSEYYGGISCDNNIPLTSRKETLLSSDIKNTIRLRKGLVNTKYDSNAQSTRLIPAKIEQISKGRSARFWRISRKSEGDLNRLFR